jgi:hypothetical protein
MESPREGFKKYGLLDNGWVAMTWCDELLLDAG